MGKLNGKVAIITGSSSGIGRATALLFAEEGASVTIHGRSELSIQKTVELLKSKDVPDKRILVVQGEVENDQTLKDLINKTIEKFGKIDVLVNNAGIRGKPGEKSDSMKSFRYTFDVNLRSVVYLTKLAIPHLEKTKGNIVNVSSGLAIRPVTMAPFYCMAKAALDHFGRCYALILAPKGIRINTVNPGVIATEFAVKMGMTPEQYEKMRKAVATQSIPMGRDGQADEMAKAILFLATDATYCTGTNLVADGGFVQFTSTPKLE